MIFHWWCLSILSVLSDCALADFAWALHFADQQCRLLSLSESDDGPDDPGGTKLSAYAPSTAELCSAVFFTLGTCAVYSELESHTSHGGVHVSTTILLHCAAAAAAQFKY